MRRVATVLILLAIISVSCKKNNDTTVGGKTGMASLSVLPEVNAYNGYWTDDWGMVYIKYNTLDSPGTFSNAIYDDSAIAHDYEALIPEANFNGLSNGNYYVYFKGTENKVPVRGGIGITISRQTGFQEVYIPVHP